jgi:hypothetical protein
LGKYEWAGNPDVGDCSIRVLNAALEYDDGEWECQVTASDFAAQDALTSRPVKLVVRGKYSNRLKISSPTFREDYNNSRPFQAY